MTDTTEAELRAVFGRSADYYVAQRLGTAPRGTNWAAFLLSGFWLPFRRMYVVALAFYCAVAVEAVAESVVFGWLGFDEIPKAMDFGTNLAFALVCGVWGNRWYFAHVDRVIARTRALELPPDQHLDALRRAGGTRLLHGVGFMLLFVTILIGTVATFEWAVGA